MEEKLILDQEKCIQCGRCIGVCPMRILARKPDKSVAVVERRLSGCIECGQCVASCPKAALMLNGVDPESLQPMVDAPMTEIQTAMLFRGRRSVRMYKNTPVPHERLREVLEDARYAPTASNSQQVEWIYIDDKAVLHELASRVVDWASTLGGKYSKVKAAFRNGSDPILRGAPGLILAHGLKASPWAAVDCSAAVSYLELALHSRGIGSCWSGYVLGAAAQGVDLGIAFPEGRMPYAGLMIGYPAMHFVRLPPRQPLRLKVISEQSGEGPF